MSKAIDDLRHEHQAILFSLKILEKVADKAAGGMGPAKKDAADLVAFLKEFADKCHHGKEEGILFPAMERAGIRKEGGPIGAMLAEHEASRNFIRQMTSGIEEGHVSGGKKFSEAARGYMDLLQSHIKKENEILFPMGEAELSDSELDLIYEKFEAHEEHVIGSGRHEELHAMLDAFEAKYLK
ncbi:MAG TPA: hemerythrin domain-containing protein [Rectinemataceae bacterium]|nr:hemerythrin domain-containing protein [Rectinemataceae bacterium]